MTTSKSREITLFKVIVRGKCRVGPDFNVVCFLQHVQPVRASTPKAGSLQQDHRSQEFASSWFLTNFRSQSVVHEFGFCRCGVKNLASEVHFASTTCTAKCMYHIFSLC